MYSLDITLFCKLLIAHLATDFLLQPSSWIKQREQKHFKAPKLYLHAFIAASTTCILLFDYSKWLPALFIGFTHLIIDGIKSYCKKTPTAFIIDQFAHITMLLIVWIYLIPDKQNLEEAFNYTVSNRNTWIYLTSYLIATTPLGYLIGTATSKWSSQLTGKDGLEEAGKWIGIFERVIILTLILLEQYEPIGLLIAAKSILRFVESKNSEEIQKKSEYVLIGTLISLGLTLVLGLLTKYWLNY